MKFAETKKQLERIKCRKENAIMFDGKNNRILDSVYFRLALTLGGFAVWLGASYILLALA